MDSVAVVPEGTPADDYRRRELSPPGTNKDPSPPKKTNIRKRTKTGCLSKFPKFLISFYNATRLPRNRSGADPAQRAGSAASNAMKESPYVRTVSSPSDSAKATTRVWSSKTPWVRFLEGPSDRFLTITRTRPKPSSMPNCLRRTPKHPHRPRGLSHSSRRSPLALTLEALSTTNTLEHTLVHSRGSVPRTRLV